MKTTKRFGIAVLVLFLLGTSIMLSLLPAQATVYFQSDFENATHTWAANGWSGNASDTGSNSYITSISPYAGAWAGRLIKAEDSRWVWAYKSGLSYTTMSARGIFNFTAMPIHADSGYFHFLDYYVGTSNPQSSWRAIATIKYIDSAHQYWALRYAYGGSFTEGENVTSIQPAVNIYYNVELNITSTSSGAAIMWVDGVEVASVRGVNFQAGGTANALAVGEVYGDFTLGYIITVDNFIVSSTYNGPASGVSVSNIGKTTTVAGASCTFYSKWTSTVGNMSKYIFGTNNTGSWVNDTATAFSAPAGPIKWANITKTLTSTIGAVVQWRVWANNTDGVWASIVLQSFTTTNQLSVSNVGKTTTIAGASCKFYAYWTTSAGTLSKYIFGTNNTGTWVNDTATSFGGGTAKWSNITKTLSTTVGALIQWRIWANNTNAIWLATSMQSFIIATSTPSKYTVWANSGTRPDIQAAINNVLANGPNGEGIVRIPSGQWTLDANGIGGTTDWYTFGSVPYLVYSYGGIDIIGAGMYQTNLTLLPNSATYSGLIMIAVDGQNQKPLRISGISFFGRTGAAASATGDVGITIDNGKDTRVDHTSYKWMGSCGVEIFNSIPGKTSRGVVDHNQFIDMYKPDAETAGTGYGYGVGVDRTYQKGGNMQSIIWNQYGTPDQFFGSYNNVTYVEDNYFSGVRHGIVAYALGAYVSRHNNFTDMHVYYGSGFNDIHGEYPDLTFGGRYMEVYDNNFYNPANDPNYPNMYSYARAARFRGGASLVFDNNATHFQYFVNFAWDEGDTATTRPKDIYIWNNVYDGGLFDIDEGTHTEGVTYFLYAKPDYTPYQYPHPLVTSTPTLSEIGYNSTTRNNPTRFYSYWQCGSGLSGYIFGTNNTGSWVNDTWTSLSGAVVAWANATKTLVNSVGTRVNYQFWVNDTSSQWVNSGIMYLITTDISAPSYSTIGLNTTSRGYIVKFYIKWHDSSGLSKSIFSWNGTGTWANDTAYSLTGTDDWHNVTKTLPSSVGVIVGYRWFANNTGGTWSPQTGLRSLVTTQIYYFFQFQFRAIDNAPVDALVNWKLYNASQELTYTSGALSLLVGTYSLRTSYHSVLLNTTSLSTASYGNQTVTIRLSMKSVLSGYIACNIVVSSFTFYSSTTTNITVLITGASGTMTIVIDVPQNATYIEKDGVAQTGWTYSNYVIVVPSSSITYQALWEFYFGAPITPPPITIITSGSNITFYFTSGSKTTNGLTAYALAQSNTNNLTSLTDIGVGNVSYGFRLWRIRSTGALEEITSGTTTLFTFTSSYMGIYAGLWNAPQIGLSLGFDALEVTIYQRFGLGAWTAKASYVTDTILSNRILLQTWSFHLNVNVTVGASSSASYKFGSSLYSSYITGVGLKEPLTQEVQAYYLAKGDFINFLLYGYFALLGQALFYGILLFAGCATMYIQYRNMGPVILMFILFGAGGLGLWALVPAPGIFVAWLFLLVGLTVVIFRVIR